MNQEVLDQLLSEQFQDGGIPDEYTGWETPFGGFSIGTPLNNAADALLDLFKLEYKQEKYRPIIDELIKLETGIETVAIDNNLRFMDRKAYGWEDTSIGGGPVLNPLWQFGVDDDIVPPANRIYGDSTGEQGMGRVYSEMYYDTQRIVWLTFGVPKFGSLRTFLATSMDSRIVQSMTSSSMPIGERAANIAATVFLLPIIVPIYIIRGVVGIFDTVGSYVFGRLNKYYELRPTMHKYYSVVNTILAVLMVHMGLAGQSKEDADADEEKDGGELSDKETKDPTVYTYGYHKYTKSELSQLLDEESGIPEIVKLGPDIVRILGRRLERRKNAKHIFDQGQIFNQDKLNEYIEKHKDDAEQQNIPADKMQEYFNKRIAADIGTDSLKTSNQQLNEDFAEAKEKVSETYNSLLSSLKESLKDLKEWTSEAFDKTMGYALGDLAYIGFRIESGTSTSESISHSTQESALGARLKEIASGSHSKQFSWSAGKTGIWPVDIVVSTLSAGANVIGDALGLYAISDAVTRGSGYVDVPEIWSDSSFSKSYSFDISLRSRYGDPVSIYQSLFIPTALLMAGSFPLGLGKNSYTSPFMVQAFCKGLFSVPMGLMEISIKRGSAEYGWNDAGLPLSIDISVSIKDLSPMTFLSSTDAGILEPFRGNTNMQDYLATMAGIDLPDRSSRRVMFARKSKIRNLLWRKNYFNMEMVIHKIGSSGISRRFGSFAPRGAWHAGS